MLRSAFSSLGLFRRPAPSFAPSAAVAPSPFAALGVRFRGQLAPRKTKYRKSQKGRPSFPTGGSIKGTTLQFDGYGLRLLSAVRLTAGQLTSIRESVKRKIKPIKGAEFYLRVFPDVPVCVKGNETRMGKGKGAFEYWACRVPAGRVVMEVAGGGIREEVAKQALKLAQVKIPVKTEFISPNTPPRLGTLVSGELGKPEEAQKLITVQHQLSPVMQSLQAQAAAAAAGSAAPVSA
ncbi:hypothetical protein CC85DRAFT_286178 [Cutaneotrichosporon oleaginosum]|uniref:Uncharacterized protein n=1 Tax=Cutaneotrichosporon oleaginosum TaxID=879819 RepID=A0A0J0XKW4_9TREE|nr:uncharacterized protein CC85DRAFT_286178 [Cutaneotrichosporon oleaginosum]KLT41778.1 hypothetical protein CC85DRAFT_286178 [Cutaneotrichosporon oleaginosum]